MHKTHKAWWQSEHGIFVASLMLKAIDAILEIAGGFLAFFISPPMLNYIVGALVRRELIEDPGDFIARNLLALAHQYAPSVQVFIGIYLLAHGVLKIFLVYNLLKNRMWSYPLAIIIFSMFALYQIYKFVQSPNIGLILLTMLDIVVIVLTYLEYRRITAARAKTKHKLSGSARQEVPKAE